MSNLKPSMIGLDKGLNLQVAKIVAPQGSVLDTLNYEQVDFQGQKRIDGFTRFDGGQIAAVDEYSVLTLSGLGPSFVLNDLIASDLGMFGVVVKVETVAGNKVLYLAINNENNLPETGTQVYRIVAGVNQSATAFLSLEHGTVSGATPEQHYTNLLDINTALRNRVESLPGPIAGLHWFRDRLHATAGATYMSLDGTTPAIYPGDVLTADGLTSTVLDSVVLTNTRAVFLDTMIPGPWLTEGTAVTRNAVSVGLVANGYEPSTLDEIATIFEARTEQQVLDEDGPSGPYNFGWRFKHLGWKVFFENGISLYGDLPAINQNIEGVGTLGPTATTDNNGAPAVVNQGITITNMPVQVNGWKSISSNTSYSPVAADLQELDLDAVYADAYISWDGDSGVIVGDTGTLTEYSPANTIRIAS